MKSEYEISIATAGEHFLYLPLYFAVENNFFGQIPSQYRIDIDAGGLSRSDEDTLAALLDTEFEPNRSIWFAVADPAVVGLEGPSHAEDQLAVIASLITSTAFWAIDHTKEVATTLYDLTSFDRIIAFEKGTTSHRIASHISSLARKSKPIVDEVKMGSELVALKDSSEGTLALSPDIIQIQDLVTGHEGFKTIYALSHNQDYANMLVTALMSRMSVISEHRELVTGILNGLQRSILLAQSEDEAIVKFAANFFRRSSKKESVLRALKAANSAHVYPHAISVDKVAWTNAFRLFEAASGRNFGMRGERKAIELYGRLVSPYQDLSIAAHRNVLTEPLKHPEVQKPSKTRIATWRSVRLLVLGTALGVAGSVAAQSDVSTGKWVGSLVFLMCGFLFQRYMFKGMFKRSLFLHWLLWVALWAVLFFSESFGISPSNFWAVFTILATSEISMLIAVSVVSRRQDYDPKDH